MALRDLIARADDPTRCCLVFHVRTVTVAVGFMQIICLSVAVCLFAMGTFLGDEHSLSPRWFVASLSGSELSSTELAKQSDRINAAAQRASARNDTAYAEGSSATRSWSIIGEVQGDGKRNTGIVGGCVSNVTNSCLPNATRGSRSELPIKNDDLSTRSITLCVLSLGVVVTILLVGGALRRRAALLIPYLCVQLVDLCTTLVNWTAALSGSERRRWLADHSVCLPETLVRSRLDSISESSILFLVLLIGSALVLLKLCWLQCVWNCYKFVVRYRVNEAALHLSSTGFEEALANGVSRRVPFSVGRISAWRSRLAATDIADVALPPPQSTTIGLNELETEPELAGIMPPKYEDVVPTAGDNNRPPTPNYAPPPYCEPCASNAVEPTPAHLLTDFPITCEPNDENGDTDNSYLLISHNSCEADASFLPLRATTAGSSGQLMLNDTISDDSDRPLTSEAVNHP